MPRKASCCDWQDGTASSRLADVVGVEWAPLFLASFHSAHGLQASLTHSSSGEGSGHRRRHCPFRVRFADETLQDTALRYWERGCARKQTGCGAPELWKVPA